MDPLRRGRRDDTVSSEPDPPGESAEPGAEPAGRPLWGPHRRSTVEQVPFHGPPTQIPPAEPAPSPRTDDPTEQMAPPSPPSWDAPPTGGGHLLPPEYLPSPARDDLPWAAEPEDDYPRVDAPPPTGYVPADYAPPRPAPPGYAPAPPPVGYPPRRPRPGRRTVLIAAVVAAVVLVAGASVLLARTFGSAGAPAQTAAPGPTGAQADPPSTIPTPTTESPPTVSTSGLVRLGPAAAAHPSAQPVLALAERYFTAINSRDYATWSTTVVPRRATAQPQQAWLRAYRSTSDQSVEITSLTDAGPGAVTVGLSFVSTQDVADAPADLPATRICWQTRWPVLDLAGGGRIDAPPRGTTTKQAC